jgi:glycosyltransferase involved in cell wall biosynthesis
MRLNEKTNLSVIIPCFKIDENFQYLNELLKCLLYQDESSYQIVQILLINDSPEINLISFVELEYHSKITILNNEINSGQAYSRNKGAEFAIGDYLHFIDQDDLIAKDFYRNIKELKDLMIGNCYLFSDKHLIRLYKFHRLLIYKMFSNIKYLIFFLVFDNIILSPGQAILKKDVFLKLNGFPNLEKFGSDDYGLMFKYGLNNFKYKFYPKAKFYHRLHPLQGKNHLDMSLSKKSFFLSFYPKTIFSKLCDNESLIIKFIKKVTYLFFNNRLI